MTKEELNELADLVADRLMMTQKEMLTTEEVAKYMGLSKSCIHKWTANGVIPCYCPNGKRYYYDRKEIDAWIKGKKV